jgi:hypothetical protein
MTESRKFLALITGMAPVSGLIEIRATDLKDALEKARDRYWQVEFCEIDWDGVVEKTVYEVEDAESGDRIVPRAPALVSSRMEVSAFERAVITEWRRWVHAWKNFWEFRSLRLVRMTLSRTW